MQRLLKLKDVVEDILNEKPQTRDNDDILYWNVCKRYNPDVLYMGFGDVIMNPKNYGIPNRDVVTRAKRKAVEENPELKARPEIQMLREDQEHIFREFARY